MRVLISIIFLSLISASFGAQRVSSNANIQAEAKRQDKKKPYSFFRHLKEQKSLRQQSVLRKAKDEKPLIFSRDVLGISPEQESSMLPDDCYPIDQAYAIIDGPERRYALCQSDLGKPTFEGARPTPESLINDELLYQEALRHKIPLDESVADRYIDSIRKQHNLGMNEVEMIFRNSGLTLEEGKFELMKVYGKNSMIEGKVMSRIFIPQREVEQYFNENPEYKDAKYQIQIAVVPFDLTYSKKEQEQVLNDKLSKGDESQLSWCDPFWIKEKDLADDKKFITEMKPSSVSKPTQVNNSFEVFKVCKVKECRLIPLEKRYRQILTTLRGPKVGQMMDTYLDELKHQATITHL